MGKKDKSKARLDKYYYLAKEHGYRSRAAFKLIQLNKKFNFLENSSCLIDLCAAPGGWLQVAAKYMPVSSIKIGVDLDNIKPIHGVTTFQADITSEKCRFLIKKEIKHFKADIVLNDGAPNVGGQWSKDAYNQSELVLFALKLATEFLKEGGWFITKIFRSSDYNALMYVLKQLFKKVEATKPQASRNESAEIFVVCSQYKAPGFIDAKLLDPKYALKQLEDEDEMKMNSIKSIKAMFDRKVNRGGYSGKLYNEKSFKDFVQSANPYQFLIEINKIKIDSDDCRKYLNCMKPPMDYDLYFEDIQLLGKKEIQQLIIWRNKIRSKLFKKEKVTNEVGVIEPENYEEKKLEELDEELHNINKQKKKKLENEKKKKDKNDLRLKMSFIRDNDGANDGGVEYDPGLFEYITKNKIDIEELDYVNVKDDEEEAMKLHNKVVEDPDVDIIDLSDFSEDDYIEMMNDDINQNMKLYNENKNNKNKKKEKREKKRKREWETRDEPVRDTDGIIYAKNDGDVDEDGYADGEGEVEMEGEQKYDEKDSVLDDDENDDDDDDEEHDEEDNDQFLAEAEEIVKKNKAKKREIEKFENPLRKNKKLNEKKLEKENAEAVDATPKDPEENLDEDTDEEKVLGKKTKRSKKDKKVPNANEAEDNNEIEQVPVDSDHEEYDVDEIAEIRAIAKKMLRKKERLNILNKTYNRYAFSDLAKAPEWFQEDEMMHNRAPKPVSKQEILEEREMIKQVNDRMPKKVLQAKARRKAKLTKRLDRVKKKAQVISNQDEISEFSKVKQIEKLYKREISRNKEKKKYIVSRASRVRHGKEGRNIKFVDKRLKKDKRAQKAKDKKKKK